MKSSKHQKQLKINILQQQNSEQPHKPMNLVNVSGTLGYGC